VRTNWIGWQTAVFARNPSLEAVPDTGKEYGQLVQYRLRPGAAAGEIAFDNLGYADAAIASYQTFARVKKEGTIPAATRFLVCLPTPLAPVTAFIERGSQPAIEPVYEAQMLAEVDRISAAIPHDQLAIQWDTAVEFAILEGVGWESRLDDVRGGIIDRLVRIGERVPPDVEMGYHLCYGDAGHQHFVQPKDAAHLVAVANDVSARLQRPINWIHMPVPRAGRRAVLRAARQPHIAPGDGTLSRPRPLHGWCSGRAQADRGGAALRPDLRHRHGVRFRSPPAGDGRAAHGDPSRRGR